MFKSKNLNHVVRRAVYLVLTLAIAMSCFLIPASAASHPFTDVKDKDWFSGSVEWVYANGCMNGTSATRFSPNQGMTRAMLVTVLWRIDGCRRPLNGVPFEDIKFDEYYTDAVRWAYSKHIVNGTSLTTFSPNQKVTREQLVAIFYRFAIYKRLDVTGRADLNQFPDAGKVAEYARDPFSWAIDAGIINGTDGKLAPQNRALRCQAAAILQRFDAWNQEHPAPPEPDITEPTEPTEPAPSEPEVTEPKPTEPEATEPEATEHTHSYAITETKDSTCTDYGYIVHTCSCGASYTQFTEPAHTMEVAETKEVSCTEDGYTKYACKYCDFNYTEPILSTGHDWELEHHDEEGHYADTLLVCRCGWTCTVSEVGGTYNAIECFADHVDQFRGTDDFGNHSYTFKNIDWVVDVPSYDTWVCTVCGETSDTQP